jgi:pyridoxamine 5'-phosphate oxidase-like protein
MGEECRWEVLSWIDCLNLLRDVSLGRIVFTVNALPACQLVTYAMDGDCVMFRSVDGFGFDCAMYHNTVVALQVDNAHLADRPLWTVTVIGTCHAITDAEDAATVSAVPRLGGERREHTDLVAITIADISSRRFVQPSSSPDAT